MAVAYISDADKPAATASSFTFTSFAVSGTNPAILVLIGLRDASATVSSVAVSAGLTAGTPTEIITFRKDVCYLSIWAIPAPSGTGTITVTFSASVEYRANAILVQGAHQTTPCPTGDAAASGTDVAGNIEVTAGNVSVGNDMVVGIGGVTNGDGPTFQQTETYNENTGGINVAAGYNTAGAACGVNFSNGGSPASDCVAVVRVQIAAAGTTIAIPQGSVSYSGQVPALNIVTFGTPAAIIFKHA